jgi:hypothetical protein
MKTVYISGPMTGLPDLNAYEFSFAEARIVVRLRAYGNSIVPQAAAEFIRAYLETQQGEMKAAA